MWHRIQTILLGISSILIVSMFFFNFVTIAGPDGTEIHIRYYEKMPYLVLMIMLTSAHVAAAGCFKSPILQARVAIIAALLSIGFQAWIGLDVITNRHDMSFSFTALFPLIVSFLDFIAARAAMVDGFTYTAVKSMKKKR